MCIHSGGIHGTADPIDANQGRNSLKWLKYFFIPYGHPMVVKNKNILWRRVRIGTIDVEYHMYM